MKLEGVGSGCARGLLIRGVVGEGGGSVVAESLGGDERP